MTWFLPTYGRAKAVTGMLKAPGGMPDDLVLTIAVDDPFFNDYWRQQYDFWPKGWKIVTIPANSYHADALRYIAEKFPDEGFYGILSDDQWPMTKGWAEAMVEAAEDRYIVTPRGSPTYPTLRTVAGFGGNLVRAVGSLCPARAIKHNYADIIWEEIATKFNLLRPLPDHLVEHRRDGTAETYNRQNMTADRAAYEAWQASDEPHKMNERIRRFLDEERPINRTDSV